MATITLSQKAERIGEVLLFSATALDAVVADYSGDLWVLPAEAPDVMILEIYLQASSIGTMIANPELLGVGAFILDNAGGTVIDFVSTARWHKVGAAELHAWLSPDPLVLFRKGEKLNFRIPDLDTGVTGDLSVYLKAARLNEVEAVGGPIQLVR